MVKMMAEITKTDRSFEQLGLPPMELAESSSNERNSPFLYRCMYPTLQKVFILLVVVTFSAGIYVLLLKLLDSTNISSKTDIILVTGRETHNITVHQNDWDIFFQMKNYTDAKIKRRKRNVLNKQDKNTYILEHLTADELDKVREIIMKHRAMCPDGKRNVVCTKLIAELKKIIEKYEVTDDDKQISKGTDKNAGITIDSDHVDEMPTDVSKREAHAHRVLTKLRNSLHPSAIVPLNTQQTHSQNLHQHLGNPHLTDTCLLAKLLKHSYPNVQEIYDPPSPEFVVPNFDQAHVPHMRYFQPSMPSYVQSREMETHRRKLHPQDIDILMGFFQKSENLAKETVKSSATLECPSGSLVCDDNEDCIEEKQWCDGNVDCSDASDEIRCSCKSRVDKSRLCDGYFDCPFGEDEMACFGCSEGTFSCDMNDNMNMNARTTCFTKEQRCNGVNDCPNHKDEIDCNMLAPSLHKKPLFAISNTEGYLHRNYKGDWYAVCQNPYMWAHDACRRETGLIIRPPIIQMVQIDPIHKVDYINTGPGGLMQTTDSCFNSSAIFVICPDLLCGTRVDTTSQLLRENLAAENHLFGRNKRFLYPGRPIDPYHMIYYGNRMKRDVSSSSSEESIEDDSKTDERSKRAESRVVGGKPSQPAAWPWVVAIYRNGMFHCGGVILNQNWIISAAHCMHNFWDHYYEVQVGMLRRFSFSPQEQNHRVTHVIVNQHYNQVDMKDDLSLLKVEPVIQFSRWVRPICLPGLNTAGQDWLWGPAPGTICTAVGWGATVEHGADPDHLREVEVPIWERCKHREDRAGKEICAGLVEGGKDACQGDSGGPLLCRNPLNSQQWYLTGIVSHGDGCARKDEPGVYTRVSLFVKWIKYHTSSKLLPFVQPIQECPGFKCISGIAKCLPNTRKCDKIVDCLNGEDEINCNFKRSSEPVSLNTTNIQKKVDKTSREAEPKLFISSHEIVHESVPMENISSDNTDITTEKVLITSTITNKQGENNDKEGEQPESIHSKNILKESIDFEHASTLEISPSRSSEELGPTNIPVDDNDSDNAVSETVHSVDDLNKKLELSNTPPTDITSTTRSEDADADYSENITIDPVINTITENIATTSESDMQMFTVSFKSDVLESRSSVKQETRRENVETTQKNINVGEDLFVRENMSTSNDMPQNKDQEFIHSTQKTRGDSIPEVEINTEKDLFENTVTDADNNAQFSNMETTTEKLIIELLPKSKSDLDKGLKESEEIKLDDDKVSESNVNNEEISAKNLPDIEEKSKVLQKIQDIVFSELQPATIRRKHRVPGEFECRRIYQVIPYNRRCDHKADCEDGTDELDCACSDYLSGFDDKLICDGVFDCADGQDEMECYGCPDDHFLCKRSETCLPTKYVCDGKAQCPLGEDELNCFALSNGREMFYDIEEKPKINLEGFLTKRNKDDWQVVCEDDLGIEQQEESASQICRYLGFSSANRYFVKYINVKEEDIVRSGINEIGRKRRGTGEGVPVHFAFRDVSNKNETARNIVIKEPQVLKEECVPNVTKTCKSLYVFCDRSLYTNFGDSEDVIYSRAVENQKSDEASHMWPWIAKVYVEGEYKCTGILVDVTWVIVSHSCLWDSSPNENFVSVILGSHRTIDSLNGFYEQIHKVDAKKDLYRNRVVLLHLKEPAEYSNMVKPMFVPHVNYQSGQTTVCVAIGQDNNNFTISILLDETRKNCKPSNRCFVRQENRNICPDGMVTHRQWSGLISCHDDQGWYPAASFVESRGECGLGGSIIATDIDNLKNELKYYSGKVLISDSLEHTGNDICKGIRCSRGKCVSLNQMCDGVRHCEDGNDETDSSCIIKRTVCEQDPYRSGCECSMGQMKCKNGKCISKELFRDGNDDCGDGTDEPMKSSCSDYLARVMPSRLCDGVLHCHDRSDEDPIYCKCYAKRTFTCGKSSEVDSCVAPDMVCDGLRDCPNGEDERTCIGLSAPEGTPYGTGQVIVRSHGVWHSKCYPTQNHTKSELEAICRELGFLSGHAKEIKDKKYLVYSHNNLLIEPFSDVVLNNQTVIKMRNTNEPAKAIFDQDLKNCFPVIIECI